MPRRANPIDHDGFEFLRRNAGVTGGDDLHQPGCTGREDSLEITFDGALERLGRFPLRVFRSECLIRSSANASWKHIGCSPTARRRCRRRRCARLAARNQVRLLRRAPDEVDDGLPGSALVPGRQRITAAVDWDAGACTTGVLWLQATATDASVSASVKAFIAQLRQFERGSAPLQASLHPSTGVASRDPLGTPIVLPFLTIAVP